MATLIEAEVKTYAPAALTPTAHLVLRALADSAGLDHRMTWLSIPTIAQESGRAKRSAVYAALRQLRELNIIRDVPEADWPPAAHHYKATVRKINPVADWHLIYDRATETDIRQTPEGESENRNDQIRNPDPNQKHINQEHENVEKTPSSLPSAGRTTKKATSSNRITTPADDGLDPADLIDPRQAAMDRHPAGRRAAGPDTGMGLANYLRTALERTFAGRRALQVPDPINYSALAKTLNGWVRDGTAPAMIRTWMDAYAGDVVKHRTTGAPPWKSFLASRAMLMVKNQEQIDLAFNSKIMNDYTSPEYLAYWGVTPEDIAPLTPAPA